MTNEERRNRIKALSVMHQFVMGMDGRYKEERRKLQDECAHLKDDGTSAFTETIKYSKEKQCCVCHLPQRAFWAKPR